MHKAAESSHGSKRVYPLSKMDVCMVRPAKFVLQAVPQAKRVDVLLEIRTESLPLQALHKAMFCKK